ncbi:MAG TPA: hypothetical protein DDY32_02510 [Desulfobulbaceae bacterium]|nr:hypothetical protein [Desulfobulbaceae bacterium]
METTQLYLIGTTVPWFLLIMFRPKVLTFLVIVLSLFQLDWFTRYMGGVSGLNRISLVLAGLLGLRLAADRVLHRSFSLDRHLLLGPVCRLSLFFLVLTLLSNLLNDENLVLGFYELRYYFLGFAVTFGLYHYFPSALSAEFFKRCLVWIGLAQLPFSVLKWLSAGGGKTLTLDSVSGTFGGYGELVACQILVICIVLFEQLTTQRRIVRVNNYILCLLLLVPLLLSGSATASVYIVLAIVFTWWLSAVHNKNIAVFLKQFIPITILGVCSLILLYHVFWKPNFDTEKQLSLDYMIEYYMLPPVTDYELYLLGADTQMGRARAVVEAVKLIAETPWNFVLGYGSGATAEASFLHVVGKYYQSFGPLNGLGRNHYSRTLAEFGVAGMTAFIVFFAVIRNRIISVKGRASELNALFSLFLFVLSILSIYAETLTSFFFSFVLGFFLATAQVEFDKGELA